MNQSARPMLLSAAGVAAALLVWQLMAVGKVAGEALPPVTTVFAALFATLGTGGFWSSLGLDRNPENYFNEVEQAAFGTGVLVDGLDFSDDKLLQGRTFSYSDTQRARVGTNYLQLPINSPKKHVATNQRGGQMEYKVDRGPNQNPHVDYEPSSMDGLVEHKQRGKDHEPQYNAKLVREPIERTNNFKQAGETYRAFQEWERDELIINLVDALQICKKDIRERMIGYFTEADQDYGHRVREGVAQALAKRAGTDHTGSKQADDTVDQAKQMGGKTDGY